jgi:hypothetical protein
MQATVTKTDGTLDIFGSVLSLNTNDEDGFLTVNCSDQNAKVRQKTYSSGNWRELQVDPRAQDNPDQFPSDAGIVA